MDTYLIESPHELKDCTRMLQQLRSMGYLHNFDWGCKDGEHCGWAIIEAENAKQALLVVPSFDRHMAKAVKLTKFSPEDVRGTH